jgi:hypothetical protein
LLKEVAVELDLAGVLALELAVVLELGALRVALGRVVLDQVAAVLKTPTVVLRALQAHRALGTRSRPVLTGFPARVENARVGVAVAKTPQAKHAAGAALTSGPNFHWEAEARRQASDHAIQSA